MRDVRELVGCGAGFEEQRLSIHWVWLELVQDVFAHWITGLDQGVKIEGS